MADATTTPVLIVGAGPTGLVLALWLTRAGVRVRIIDKNPHAAAYSRALGVQARTLELYQQLGIADAVVAGGVPVQGVNLWVQGERTVHVPFRDLGEGLTPFPYVLDFAQDAHERLLLEALAAAGVQVERCTELVGFEQDEEGVRATLRRSDDEGDDERVRATFLAGCDGAHSTVRQTLGVTFAGGTYERLFFVADVNASGPATNGEIHIDLDSADLLVVFPMKGEGRVRLVGTVLDAARAEGREITFDDVGDRALHELKLDIERVNWFSTYRVHHRVAERFRVQRAFLLGDAAHVHSPVGGQGMNTGIGDAVNLAWKLAEVLKGRARRELLDTYAPERMGFAHRLVSTTDRVFVVATRPGRLPAFVRTRIVPPAATRLFRVKALRRFLFHTVSQLGIEYRASALSKSAGGATSELHAGDRLPWLPALEPALPPSSAGREASNFVTLTAMSWQVHVYGDAKPELADACRARSIPLHVFTWTPQMEATGLRRDALYLVRPDGYIALTDGGGGPAALEAYVKEWEIGDGSRPG